MKYFVFHLSGQSTEGDGKKIEQITILGYTISLMKAKNPFETLGITPALVRALEGKELFSLIKSSYRALLLIYHPDRSPLHDQALKIQKTQKVAEINLALEKLNHDRDPDSLDYYRNLYIRRIGEGWKKTIRQLNREIQELGAFNEILSRGYLQHLLKPCFPDQQDKASGSISVFNLKNSRFGIQDIAINHNVRSMTWDLGTNYKEIKFDAEGRMFYKLPCRKRFIQVNFIKLLGTVEKEKVDLIPLLDRVVPQDLVVQQEKGKKSYPENSKCFDILNSLPVEEFRRHCLPFLKPDITEGSFLFSLHRKPLQENRINLEGLIIRSHPG
ncbi:MAG: J domain-containing protein [Pseudomonadota bacterium]